MPDEIAILSPAEVRVLGALVEKQITTPDYYPLTLNALTNACNQSSNRDPVVAFDETTVVRALDALREKKLAYLTTGGQSRVPKYSHRLGERLELNPAETAVLCELMLRGPQTDGELRGRASRMHAFAALAEVGTVLEALTARSLVQKLARQTGFKEPRYVHCLGGPVAIEAGEVAPPPEPATLAVRAETERLARLETEVAALRAELVRVRQDLEAFRRQFQ